MVQGRLHSIETMGLVDGPGIRTIFFLQGCPLRCLYCHNPDSQIMFSKRLITSEEVLEIANKYRPYYKRTGGGITFSGGEPMLQGEFLSETLKLLKSEGFNTAIDTSGYGDEEYYTEILKYTDTIILDIKQFDDEGYRRLTGKTMSGFYKFMSYLSDFRGTIWIRHVMVPSMTDNIESMCKLFDRISHLADKIDRIEILPYHTMAVEKYANLGRQYPLKGIPEMDPAKAKRFEEMLTSMLHKEKQRIILNKGIVS